MSDENDGSSDEDLREWVPSHEDRVEDFNSYNKTHEAYHKVDHSDLHKSDLLTILQRYNSIWELDKATYHTSDKLSAPQFVPEHVPGFILERFNHPFFYRMNFIQQLSTTSLRENLGGTHTRLGHSLGVTAIANAFIQELERGGEEISENAKNAVFLYAFVHDSFHGPFGHSLDLVKSLFQLSDYKRKLDKNQLYEQFEKDESLLRDVISEAFPDSDEEEIINYLQFFNRPHPDGFSEEYYLSEILDSALDADRLDYLFRDSLHLKRQTTVSTTDMQQLIRSVGVAEVAADGTKIRRLCYPLDMRKQIEDLLKMRRDLYTDVYEAPEKIAVDEMIAHALFYLLDHFEVDGFRRDDDNEIFDEIVKLTDQGLFQFLFEVGEPFYVRELARSIATNSFHIPIQKFGLPLPNEGQGGETEEGDQPPNVRVNRRISEEMEFTGRDIDKSEARQIREILEDEELGFEGLLYHMAFRFQGLIHKKVELEEKLWDLLLSEETIDDEFNRYLRTEYGDVESFASIESVRSRPHVYVSFPTYLGHDVEVFEQYTKEKGGDEMVWCGGENINLDIPLRDDFKVQNVVLCGPEPLAGGDSGNEVSEVFREFVTDTEAWIRPGIY